LNILGIDRDEVAPLKGVKFIKGDINKESTRIQIPTFFNLEPVDSVILSCR
jgi:23S rRNA U2552 (ribose-2'-O)-methylase RlmE/FtsJ